MEAAASIKICNKDIGEGFPVFIVAEVANAHNGDFETAKRMIEIIKDTGVDAVKFQLHIPEEEMIRRHPKFESMQKRSLSAGEISELKKIAEGFGLCFLCTPFSPRAADELEAMGVVAFKVGSGEMTNLPLLEHIAKKGKPVIISTGMSNFDEIEEAVQAMKKFSAPYIVLHTVSLYPPRYEALNLAMIKVLRERFKVPIGLSDHTPEIFSAIASVPYGVNLIEKHYTLDRNQSGTGDHKISLEPQEWKILVDGIRKIEKACGSEKRILDEEKEGISWARHGVVALEDISAGETILASSVGAKRPLADGIPAKELPKVVGSKAARDIKKDELIKWEDLNIK